jgi:hypothetical protein
MVFGDAPAPPIGAPEDSYTGSMAMSSESCRLHTCIATVPRIRGVFMLYVIQNLLSLQYSTVGMVAQYSDK